MKTFTDNEGRTWEISINVATIRRLRDALGVDLLKIVEPGNDLLERFSTDPVLLADCIFVLCREQARQRNISDEQFGQALAGDAIDAATSAFLEELVNFFPTSKRLLLTKILEKVRQATEKLTQAVSERIDQINVEKIVARSMQEVSGSSSTSSQVSSE